jgi:hypothetical protein
LCVEMDYRELRFSIVNLDVFYLQSHKKEMEGSQRS